MNNPKEKPNWHYLSPHTVAKQLRVEPNLGLTNQQAAEQLKTIGLNRLLEASSRSPWLLFVELAAGSLALGNQGVIGDLKGIGSSRLGGADQAKKLQGKGQPTQKQQQKKAYKKHYKSKSYLYGRQAEDLKTHCQRLVTSYENAVEANRKMAEMHRGMAQ